MSCHRAWDWHWHNNGSQHDRSQAFAAMQARLFKWESKDIKPQKSEYSTSLHHTTLIVR